MPIGPSEFDPVAPTFAVTCDDCGWSVVFLDPHEREVATRAHMENTHGVEDDDD